MESWVLSVLLLAQGLSVLGLGQSTKHVQKAITVTKPEPVTRPVRQYREMVMDSATTTTTTQLSLIDRARRAPVSEAEVITGAFRER